MFYLILNKCYVIENQLRILLRISLINPSETCVF